MNEFLQLFDYDQNAEKWKQILSHANLPVHQKKKNQPSAIHMYVAYAIAFVSCEHYYKSTVFTPIFSISHNYVQNWSIETGVELHEWNHWNMSCGLFIITMFFFIQIMIQLWHLCNSNVNLFNILKNRNELFFMANKWMICEVEKNRVFIYGKSNWLIEISIAVYGVLHIFFSSNTSLFSILFK